MKLNKLKYEIGDVLLIQGTELQIERCLTVSDIRINLEKVYGSEIKQINWYRFKESKLMYREDAIIKKVDRK